MTIQSQASSVPHDETSEMRSNCGMRIAAWRQSISTDTLSRCGKAAHFRAYFQQQGQVLGTKITTQTRTTAANSWQAVGAQRKPGPHDIEGWSILLVARRDFVNHPYPPPFATRLVDGAANVYLHWKEYMRYRAFPVYRDEVALMRSEAKWFHQNYGQM